MSEEKYIIEGIVQDPVDDRDLVFGNTSSNESNNNMVQYVREIEQQGSIGSCVGNSGVSALELMCFKNGVNVNLSRLFAYYNVRMVDDRIGQEGAYVRSIFKSINKYGLPTEEQYPYDTSLQNDAPSQEIYDLAAQFIVTKYEKVYLNWKSNVKGAIDSGFPIVFGIEIFDDFYNMPYWLEAKSYKATGKSLGGHAMVIVGYDKDFVIVENSWGKSWGNDGLCAISWEILARDGMEGWVATEIKMVSPEPEPIPEPIKPEPVEPPTPKPKIGFFARLIAFLKSLFGF